MDRRKRIRIVVPLVALLALVPLNGEALVDDFEEDFWLPFTHFNLGDRASAGYASGMARSGERSYRVAIQGWAVRDFGSAYGYALFGTGGAAITRLRVAVLHASLADAVPSPWDGFAAGIGLTLLDGEYRTLGSFRYLTAHRSSLNGGRCGPTTSDVVLGPSPPVGAWADIGRDPSADFPAAPWASASFVKVSIGFLCAAGLTGASYVLYFDDFALHAASGDGDGDGLEDLEEDTRRFVTEIAWSGLPAGIPVGGARTLEIVGPQAFGLGHEGALRIDLDHPRPTDLSVTLEVSDGVERTSHLLWDPGFHARRIAILRPSHGQAVRGDVEVVGGTPPALPGSEVRLFLDDVPVDVTARADDGSFAFVLRTDAFAEGDHVLRTELLPPPGEDGESIVDAVLVVIDRTPPDVRLEEPSDGAVLRGLAVIEAQAFDARGVADVELAIDGAAVDRRREEPYVFVYDTLDLPNGDHAFRVRARDEAGNEATREVRVSVSNDAPVVLRPCLPACILPKEDTGDSLPPPSALADARTFTLMGGTVRTSEVLRIPSRPRVAWSESGVSLVLDLLRDVRTPEADGVVAPRLPPGRLGAITEWRLTVRDHGEGEGGTITGAAVLLASRLSSASPDTDGDSLPDGVERSSAATSPVLADGDADGLRDDFELEAFDIVLSVERTRVLRTVRTDPARADTDGDGLSDGQELLAAPEGIPTDPTVADTDGDGLPDGLERLVFGTDPTLRDTDGDTLSDFLEVLPRELGLVVDGVPATRSITTSPISPDTDRDGLWDNEEWEGVLRFGFLTDPTEPDTDRDGLSDFDEISGLNRRPTNPVVSDTDGDGLADGLDLSPTELWQFPWTTMFDPGLVRFTQRFEALGVHAMFAYIYTHRITDGACVFLSDHTDDATRSSDESDSNVQSTMNRVLRDGGQVNFTATSARHLGQLGFGIFEITYGACDAFAPRQYRFQYIHDIHRFDIDFVNTLEVTIPDEDGELFYQTTLDVPIRLSKAQSIILQTTVSPEADRGGETADGRTVVPAFVFALFRGREFLSTPPFFQNLAVGAAIDEHAYEFQLRIPSDVARPENVTIVGGVPTATLVLMPAWLTTDGSRVEKTALNATRLRVAAAISRVQETAEVVVARLVTDMEALAAALPPTASDLPTGYRTFGPFRVYVYRLGDPFDPEAPGSSDAIYFLGNSSEEIATFQESIAWTPKSAWARESKTDFGLVINIFKIIRRGISLSSQLTAAIFLPLVSVPPGASESMSFDRSTLVVTKLENPETGLPYYVIGETAVEVVKVRVPHPEIPGVELTEVRTIEREVRGEIVDDIDDSRILAGARYSNLRLALRGAAVGATLVVFGGQAVIAFRDGDVIKGTFYAAAGATAVFGVLRADIPLFEDLFAATRILKGRSIKLGTAAAVAVGAILATYEMYLATQLNDPILKLSHYESAGGIFVDAIVSVVPLYGAAAMLGWQLGLTITVAAQALLGVMPNPLALKIVSSPGSTIVFFFEYVFGSEIPSSVAQDALIQLLNFLANIARFNNAMLPARPTVLLVP